MNLWMFNSRTNEYVHGNTPAAIWMVTKFTGPHICIYPSGHSQLEKFVYVRRKLEVKSDGVGCKVKQYTPV
jgi:hypothetical protein